jgi:glycosyltransferase involved in cell wall biosynthesis
MNDDSPDGPLVSVIVPVRNGRTDLLRLLEALGRQTVPRDRFELVIGNDGSSDGSTDGLETPDGLVRVAAGPPRNSYAARNRAVRASRAPILAFCDSDCVPEPEWIESGIAALRKTDIVAGRVRFDVPQCRTVWTLLDMDASKDHEREVRNATAETANLFLRRTLFDRVGGFEAEIPEFGDFDFVQRCVAEGAELSYGPDVVVWHPTRNRAKPFLRAQWIYSRGYGAREGREGRVPQGLRLRALVPVVQPLRARRGWGRTVGPDRKWLGANGVEPTAAENAKALPIMYLLLPYLRATAQFVGWVDGRRLRRAPQQSPEGS